MGDRTLETDASTIKFQKENVKLMIKNDTRRVGEIHSLEIDPASMKAFFLKGWPGSVNAAFRKRQH